MKMTQQSQPITEQVIGKLKITFDASFEAILGATGQPFLQVLFEDQMLLCLNMAAHSITSQTLAVTITPNENKVSKVTILLYEYASEEQRSKSEIFVQSVDEAGNNKFGGNMYYASATLAMEHVPELSLHRGYVRQIILIEPVSK